jgi:bifunctional ADP-heptose synthase (sugar kinase/adenylyltransferase)
MKILVIGDSCVDIFRYGRVDRLAPEAPIPVIVPEKETSTPGMAGNVVKNLEALKCNVEFITNNSIIRKIRYVCSKYNYILLRVDENDRCERITPETFSEINWLDYEAIVISDYCKGFLTEEDIKYISKQHPLTFLDSKKLLGDWAYDISFIKINSNEYEKNKTILTQDPILFNKTIITRGKFGCNYQNTNFPTKEVPVKDVSGAGDTFLAGLVCNYISTKNIESSIKFAQDCTTVVVQKLGVSTI